MKKFLFVCGGTGGHIFPAVAIAESLKKMGVEDIVFAGRKDSMEERLVSKNWPYEFITAVPLHRGPFLKNLTLPFNLSKSLVRAKSVIKKVKPDVVVATDAIGMGMNLPIRRIVFLEDSKFDGKEERPLYDHEIKQIAGRAGRFGIYNEGLYNAIFDPEYLRDMIRLVNRTQLQPQDVLSDSLYFFDRETGKISIA